MSVCFGWSILKVLFKSVASVVELAYITTNVVLDHETTTRMLLFKTFDIENKVVEKDELFAVRDPFIKLFS